MIHITLHHVADLIGLKVFINKQTYMKYVCLCIAYFVPLTYFTYMCYLYKILDPRLHNVCLCLHLSLH